MNQKVSKTPRNDGLSTLQADKDAKNPILQRLAPKTASRKYNKSEIKVALHRANSDVDQAKKALNVAKKLADDQQKHAMAWKKTAEDAQQKKRAHHSEMTLSEK